MEIDDFYADDAYLRRWHLDGRGQAVCPFPAAPVVHMSLADRQAIVAANAAVRETIESVEAYEAALRLRAGEPPPPETPVVDEDGETSLSVSPASLAWAAAGQTIADAPAAIVALAALRADPPETVDPIADAFPQLTALANGAAPSLNLAPLPRWRFKAMLRLTGHDADITAWLADLNDPQSPNHDPQTWAVASAILEDSDAYRFDHPITGNLRQIVGVSEAELKTLWTHAHTL